MKHDERLLSRRDVEERFGISKRFLEKVASSGEGPKFVRIGRSVRYSVKEVRAWIEQNTVQGDKGG